MTKVVNAVCPWRACAYPARMKVTYCQDRPKRFILERDEPELPIVGNFVELAGTRYLIRRVERVAREALAYVIRD